VAEEGSAYPLRKERGGGWVGHDCTLKSRKGKTKKKEDDSTDQSKKLVLGRRGYQEEERGKTGMLPFMPEES